MAFISGNRDFFVATDDHVLDLKNGLDFLRPRNDGVGFLKRLGMNGFVAKSTKHEWTETALAVRTETVTINDSATTLGVADAYIYQVNDIIRIEDEFLRVTAIAPSGVATNLTVARGYGASDAAAHTGKTAQILGSAAPENSTAPAGRQDSPTRLYNYVQTFDIAVDLSNDEIMSAHTEGNPLTGNLARRTIEWYQKFAAAVFYGQRELDATNKIRTMGGIKSFITTNPTSVGGALSIAAIDAEILQIVEAGGDPKVLVMSPYQKQKLDALDANLVRINKEEKKGGYPNNMVWQSGVMDHTLDIVVDPTILRSEMYILDTDHIKLGYLAGNGDSGSLKVVDASTPGQDGKRKRLIGKYTLRVETEKAHSILTGLS
jgi:hypothetical protein